MGGFNDFFNMTIKSQASRTIEITIGRFKTFHKKVLL